MRELMDDRLLDALVERSRDEAGGLRLTGEGSMLGELVKAVLERALEAELTAHLGYEKHDLAGRGSGNSRNGVISKKVQTGIGPVGLEVPRDRAGTFEPVLIPKRSGRVCGGLDDMIISLYARHDRPRHPAPPGAGLWHPAVARDRLPDHRRRPGRGPRLAGPAAGPGHAVVFLDAIMVKVRDNHVVASKPAYLAAGIDADGEKHVLGIWLAKTPPETATADEGSRFWASVMADLRNRGVRDILIACCDGLAGFEDAICAAFPHTTVQRYVVHLVRNALRPVARKEAAAVAAGLRTIYTAPGEEAALDALAEFAASPLGKRRSQCPAGRRTCPATPGRTRRSPRADRASTESTSPPARTMGPSTSVGRYAARLDLTSAENLQEQEIGPQRLRAAQPGALRRIPQHHAEIRVSVSGLHVPQRPAEPRPQLLQMRHV